MLEDLKEKVLAEMPKIEVDAKAKRRQYSAEYKLRILREVDACQEHGEIGALLRREGFYSLKLTNWRQHSNGNPGPRLRKTHLPAPAPHSGR
jgi:transposase-like protein